jgi:hypothetical protein
VCVIIRNLNTEDKAQVWALVPQAKKVKLNSVKYELSEVRKLSSYDAVLLLSNIREVADVGLSRAGENYLHEAIVH